MDNDIKDHNNFNPPLPDEEPPDLFESIEDSDSQLSRSRPFAAQSMTRAKSKTADSWQAIYDSKSSKFYFYNRDTHVTTWDNPRALSMVHESALSSPSATNPIDYAKHFEGNLSEAGFTFEARFDRRTGKFISDPERDVNNYSEHARSDRQLSRYFDDKLIDDSGASAKAARRSMKHSKAELAAFKQKHKEKRDHRRRSWLIAD